MSKKDHRDLNDGFLLGIIERLLEHPELVRVLIDRYFSEIDLNELGCTSYAWTAYCTHE